MSPVYDFRAKIKRSSNSHTVDNEGVAWLFPNPLNGGRVDYRSALELQSACSFTCNEKGKWAPTIGNWGTDN